MRRRDWILVLVGLAILLACSIRAARASTGLQPPLGAVSNAYNIVPKKQVMNLDAHPSLIPDSRSAAYCEAQQQRYGHVPQVQPGVCLHADTHGRGHSSEHEAFLHNICTLNPSFFAERGYGVAITTDGCWPTVEETNDSMFALGVEDAVFDESKRLSGVVVPIPCGDGELDPGEDCHTCPADAGRCQPPPPPPPPPPPSCPTLAAVPSDVRETVGLIGNWLRAYKAGAARRSRVARLQAWLDLVENYQPKLPSCGALVLTVTPQPCTP